MNEIKYCCHTFEWLVNDAGRKGFSALIKKHLDNYYFVMQGRNFDEEHPEIRQSIFEIGIKFCPSCGHDLSVPVSALDLHSVCTGAYTHANNFVGNRV